jgi:hypothetical protein
LIKANGYAHLMKWMPKFMAQMLVKSRGFIFDD